MGSAPRSPLPALRLPLRDHHRPHPAPHVVREALEPLTLVRGRRPSDLLDRARRSRPAMAVGVPEGRVGARQGDYHE